jgi:tryptophan 2,3-dioxygenase
LILWRFLSALRPFGENTRSGYLTFKHIYDDPHGHWNAYAMCEKLVDLEEHFQIWRFRHMKTVERIIGYKRGTGGSSGVPFLKQALEQVFFPELLDVRTEIGA